MSGNISFDYREIYGVVRAAATRLHGLALGADGSKPQENYRPIDLLDGLYCDFLLWDDKEVDIRYYLYSIACIESVFEIFRGDFFIGDNTYFDPVKLGGEMYSDEEVLSILENDSGSLFSLHLQSIRCLLKA